MIFNKVSKEQFQIDFRKTFTEIDMNDEEINESINAIYELIQTPVYNNIEHCHYIVMPFGIELLPTEHAIFPLGIECNTPNYKSLSDNPNYTVETVTQTGDIFVHIENIGKELIQFEPDQVFAKIIGVET